MTSEQRNQRRSTIDAPAISRGWYLLSGVLLLMAKVALDRTVAAIGFSRTWGVGSYIAPGREIADLIWNRPDRVFYATMLAIAVPFIATGVVLTVRRLRDAGLSRALAFLFFVPAVNLIFFLLLSIVPSRKQEAATSDNEQLPPLARVAPPDPSASPGIQLKYGKDQPTRTRSAVMRCFPAGKRASAAVAILLPQPFLIGLTLLSVRIFSYYGWGMFVALPFLLGFCSALLYGIREPRTMGQCMGVAAGATIVAGAVLISFAIEGLLCLIMALPLALPIALIGAGVGFALQDRPLLPGDARRMLLSALLFLPLFMGAERLADPDAPVYAATTTVEVDAPPEAVWEQVVSFDRIPPPDDWMFRAGIAYPVEAQIEGHGVGAVRHCVFSTGAFIEPITVWDEARLLKFNVSLNPPALREWSPWDIHPPHVQNFLVSSGGQFKLIPLPHGRTRLEGTTWYRHNLWPAGYWQLWSNAIIHRIHKRVLNHVKALSERQLSAGT